MKTVFILLFLASINIYSQVDITKPFILTSVGQKEYSIQQKLLPTISAVAITMWKKEKLYLSIVYKNSENDVYLQVYRDGIQVDGLTFKNEGATKHNSLYTYEEAGYDKIFYKCQTPLYRTGKFNPIRNTEKAGFYEFKMYDCISDSLISSITYQKN